MLLRAALVLALSGGAAAAPMHEGCPVLPANNIWNARVDTLPVHPKSATYVNAIGAASTVHMNFGSEVSPPFPSQNAAPVGIPFVSVPGDQAPVPIEFVEYRSESDPGPYPIPPGAPIEGVGPANAPGNRHVVVIDRGNCVLYELYRAFPADDGSGWTASSGARWPLASNNLRTEGWISADGAGLPIFPGLVKYHEASALVIEHALRFTAPATQRKYVWPATHFASASTDANLPPMGLRVRLKASVDIEALSPIPRAIAQAMKTYGLMLADNGPPWWVSGAPNLGWNDAELRELDALKGSDFEAVDVSSLMLSPTSGQVAMRPSTTTLASSANPSAAAQNVTFTATVAGTGGTPTGAVTFTHAGATLCNAAPLASGTAVCSTNALASGSRPIKATYSGDGLYAASASVALSQVVTSGASLVSATPATRAFGGQSMNTTSPSQAVTLTNMSASPVALGAVVAPQGFAVSHNCGTLPAGANCTASITFTPDAAGPMNNFLAVTYPGGGPTTVALTGTGERSLVTHYYRAILRRAPDTGGKAFWDGEALRVSALGVNVNETWFAMAQTFYSSAEYAAFNRNNSAFATDLYATFFNRAPDTAGLNFWISNLGQGMPREVALAEFMFSPEFRNFSQAIFGASAARAEVGIVVDFYRGLLSRLPDDGGFNHWVARFRAAQCQGTSAIVAEVEAISSLFALSAEYIARGRTNAQYVGDLYNAFLRRGGDLAGVQHWIGQLNTNAQTREQLRAAFKNSAEFQARVNAVIAQGCLP